MTWTTQLADGIRNALESKALRIAVHTEDQVALGQVAASLMAAKHAEYDGAEHLIFEIVPEYIPVGSILVP